MSSSPDPDVRKVRFAWIVLGLHAVALGLMALRKAFNSDEFEHVHIAWNMKQGLLVYRDFFDNHGPLFPLLNELVWRVTSLPDEPGTLLVFRLLGLLWASLMCGLTAAIAGRVAGRHHAVVAAALLSTSLVFLEKGIEIRPDGPQVVCWLACVYFLLVGLETRRASRGLLAGLFLGLSLAANTKMLVGLAAIAGAGAWIAWRSRGDIGWALRMGLGLATGLSLALLPFALIFAARDALPQLIHYVWTVNFAAASQVEATRFVPELFGVLATHFFFVAASLAGALAVLRRPPPGVDGPAARCILILAAVTVGFAPNGYYTQYYLIFLPLLAVLGAVFLMADVAPGTWGRRVMALAFALQLPVVALSALGLMFDGRQQLQLDEMALVMDHTPADEPVAFTGLDQGGYVFRPDLQFYWTNSDNLQRVMSRLEGRPIFGPDFVAKLDEKKPTFVISLNSDWERVAFPTESARARLPDIGVSVRSYPEATQRYIAEHYQELDKLHLLVRREALTPELRAAAEALARRFPSAEEALGP